jgi:hypothetical protein
MKKGLALEFKALLRKARGMFFDEHFISYMYSIEHHFDPFFEYSFSMEANNGSARGRFYESPFWR